MTHVHFSLFLPLFHFTPSIEAFPGQKAKSQEAVVIEKWRVLQNRNGIEGGD